MTSAAKNEGSLLLRLLPNEWGQERIKWEKEKKSERQHSHCDAKSGRKREAQIPDLAMHKREKNFLHSQVANLQHRHLAKVEIGLKVNAANYIWEFGEVNCVAFQSTLPNTYSPFLSPPGECCADEVEHWYKWINERIIQVTDLNSILSEMELKLQLSWVNDFSLPPCYAGRKTAWQLFNCLNCVKNGTSRRTEGTPSKELLPFGVTHIVHVSCLSLYFPLSHSYLSNTHCRWLISFPLFR